MTLTETEENIRSQEKGSNKTLEAAAQLEGS
jgi:hypothetical protein